MRTRRVAVGCVLGAALSLPGGAASASPLAVPEGEKILAQCDSGGEALELDLLVLRGRGTFTPYPLAVGGGLFVPSELQIDAAADLKSRHYVTIDGVDGPVKLVSKGGGPGTGAVTCSFEAAALDVSGELQRVRVTLVGRIVETGQPAA